MLAAELERARQAQRDRHGADQILDVALHALGGERLQIEGAEIDAAASQARRAANPCSSYPFLAGTTSNSGCFAEGAFMVSVSLSNHHRRRSFVLAEDAHVAENRGLARNWAIHDAFPHHGCARPRVEVDLIRDLRE